MRKIAVGVGYSFNLFTLEEVSHISKIKSGSSVKVDGKIYEVYIGSTFPESQKIDALLDEKGEKRLNEYRIN